MSTKLDARLARLEARAKVFDAKAEELLVAWGAATLRLLSDDELDTLDASNGNVTPEVQAMWDRYSVSPAVAREREAYLRFVGEWHESNG